MTCRLCFGEEDDLTKFVAPCKCTGSMKYIHPQCQQEYITAYDWCPVCLFPFQFTWRKIFKYSLMQFGRYTRVIWTTIGRYFCLISFCIGYVISERIVMNVLNLVWFFNSVWTTSLTTTLIQCGCATVAGWLKIYAVFNFDYCVVKMFTQNVPDDNFQLTRGDVRDLTSFFIGCYMYYYLY